MPSPFDTYLAKIESDLRRGKATEHTYRSSLEWLLETLAPGVDASNDPKHIACGAPDFIVERGKVPLGYAETKDVGEDLDKIEKGEQLKRYRASLNNLILTDYLEFRWYVNGAHKLTVRLATVGADRRVRPLPDGIAKAAQLFTEFYQTEVPTVGTPKDLAQRLAALAQITRDLIAGSLREEAEAGVFHQQLEAFRHHLLPTLTPDEFADIYAQTMAYGLFAARVNMPEGQKFSRAQAYIYLPPANPFLRKLFLDVGEELDGTPIAPFLDDLAALLARADMAAILRDFGKRTRTEDPVVHFYETFLAAYNPRLRKSRGVYYTPEPGVQFIVSSIDWLLRTRFNLPLGLADPGVNLLDPATGTATFLYFAIRRIYETLMERGQAGAWKEYVREKLLPRLFGFELLMAPYAVAHLKLGLLLSELGYTFGKHDRVGVYLTNTLDDSYIKTEKASGTGWYLAEEGAEAAEVKKTKPIMVVFGNPPYSNFGMMNKGDWIRGLLEDYKKDLNEKKLNLDDDFIKFIRFGQWRIEQTGQGILAFITNNTFIDGLTHRRMRQSLMETFTDIYILDLHGSSKKKETAPDGSRDENVFDIQQGVAISIFVKEPGKSGPARVHHAELWGTRESKYEVLSKTDVQTTKWTELMPKAEHFFFEPKDFDAEKEYFGEWRLSDIFSVKQNGLKTDRDDLFFDFERKVLEKRIKTFYSDAGITSPFRETYRVEDSSSYDLLSRRRNTSFDPKNIHLCLYRPFDWRWLYYAPGLTSRPAWDVMRYMLEGDNIALICLRQTRRDEAGTFLAAKGLINKDAVSLFDIGTVFPLYLYTTLLHGQSDTMRTPNLAPEFVRAVEEKLGMKFSLTPSPVSDRLAGRGEFTPEDIFHYAYAIFHSPTYRTRYAELLKIDFPRLPLTSDRKLFAKLAARGAELVSLHLMKSPALDEFITTFPVEGSNEVEKVRYEKKKVRINEAQYFGGVPEAAWEFKVGGYQVCEKWLKDRKGRTLSGDDLNHYQRIVVALKETLRLMKEIDAAIPKWPIA
jgi:predicted helicase